MSSYVWYTARGNRRTNRIEKVRFDGEYYERDRILTERLEPLNTGGSYLSIEYYDPENPNDIYELDDMPPNMDQELEGIPRKIDTFTERIERGQIEKLKDLPEGVFRAIKAETRALLFRQLKERKQDKKRRKRLMKIEDIESIDPMVAAINKQVAENFDAYIDNQDLGDFIDYEDVVRGANRQIIRDRRKIIKRRIRKYRKKYLK